MGIVVGSSFIASFTAGIGALFAPCCITVLLPTYLASIFRQKITVFLMTFVYFLGLLTVFIPLGIGASFLSEILRNYHNTIFLLGGIFLVLLGLSLITGVKMSIPVSIHPKLKNSEIGSVFVLGIFSGIATTCCAPVLAGVLALSFLPGSIILGGAYALTYVLGMVIPLFIIASFLDKANLTSKLLFFRKTLSYPLFGKKISTSFSNLFSGVVFLVMGGIILNLVRTNSLYSHSSYQISINIYLAKITQAIGRITVLVPDFVWPFLFVGIFLFFVKKAVSQILKTSKGGGK